MGRLHFDHFPLSAERVKAKGGKDRVKFPWQWRGVLCRDCNTSLITHGRSGITWIGADSLRASVRAYLARWRKRVQDHYRYATA